MTHSFIKPPKKPFMEAKIATKLMPNAINFIGIPFDGTSCFRKGADLGPDDVREVSDGIESYSPYLDSDLEKLEFYDLGDLAVNQEDWNFSHQHFSQLIADHHLKKENIKLLTFGGEHSISISPINHYLEQYPELLLVHLDAHADLRDGYEGFHHSHASVIYRVTEHFTDEHDLIQYGIRSGTKEEYDWMKERKTLCHSRDEFIKSIENVSNSRPIYLTLDLDYFDPSEVPGTGTPEAGGETFHSFISLVKILKAKNLVGADVVELAPALDSSGISSCLAAKVVRELALSF